eukprot:3706734-Pleurochrysis_carterae.AAC.5
MPPVMTLRLASGYVSCATIGAFLTFDASVSVRFLPDYLRSFWFYHVIAGTRSTHARTHATARRSRPAAAQRARHNCGSRLCNLVGTRVLNGARVCLHSWTQARASAEAYALGRQLPHPH